MALLNIDFQNLDSIAKEFFKAWKHWRISQNWTLGPDKPEAKMSPYLVNSWDGLDEEGKHWFIQHAALALYASQQACGSLDNVHHSYAGDGNNKKVIQKLHASLSALDEFKTQTARRKVRTALRLLQGEPIRKKAHKNSVRLSSTL